MIIQRTMDIFDHMTQCFGLVNGAVIEDEYAVALRPRVHVRELKTVQEQHKKDEVRLNAPYLPQRSQRTRHC
jgi:hypothetical protein